jgi:hypothetical protein
MENDQTYRREFKNIDFEVLVLATVLWIMHRIRSDQNGPGILEIIMDT